MEIKVGNRNDRKMEVLRFRLGWMRFVACDTSFPLTLEMHCNGDWRCNGGDFSKYCIV